jgi:translation initiation factor IF-3
VNTQITAREVRLIDETGENAGIVSIEKARALAGEKGLDLVEIAAKAKPPVVRIISFDKFRYQKEKESKKQKKGTQGGDLKHIRITPRAAAHDLELKLKQTEEFLQKGHRLEINLFLKGREKAHKDWGRKKLEEFLAMITTPVTTTMEPRYAGRGFVTQIAKKQHGKEEHQKKNQDNEDGKDQTPPAGPRPLENKQAVKADPPKKG